MLDMAVLAGEIASIVSEEVERATAPLLAENSALSQRVLALEARSPLKGDPGKDADPEVIQASVEVEVAKAVAAIRVPEDGKSVDPEEVVVLVDRAVAKAVAAIPPAESPEPIAPDMDAIGEVIEQSVSQRVRAIPAPKDGASVTLDDVRPLIEESIAKAVAALPPAKDGVGVAGAVIDRDDNLYLTLTDGTVRDLGRVVGRDADMPAIEKAVEELVAEKVAAIPVPKDGKDGFQLEDFEAQVLDDGRTIRFAMTAGDTQHAYQLSFPVLIDRGVWKEGQEYEAGDGVTWAGSYWIAQKQTTAKPDSGEGFRLAVKRGRDGRDKV